jgi:hypothetical protein
MKTLDATQDQARHRVEAHVAASMRLLFYRHPELCGFVVCDRAGLPERVRKDNLEGELFITDIGLFPRVGKGQYDAVYDEIARAITRMVDERPEAKQVMIGRAFARSMH